MYRLARPDEWGLAIASLALLVGAGAWIVYSNSGPHIANDYEECAEDAQANAASRPDYFKLIKHCGERFAGRRKIGGGYTYFDFLQNRSFDIAGPNPSEDERKRIDRFYMEFLGSERREMLLADLAKAQANLDQATSERDRRDIGAPLALAPKIPLPAKRPGIERPKACEGGSLSCSWAKLSAAVRNAFASSAATNR
jgi:hypothetical protein